MFLIIFLIVPVILWVLGCFYGAYAENVDWANGACSCGRGFWIHFDVNSQGGFGYKCSVPNCNHVTWQSWRTRC